MGVKLHAICQTAAVDFHRWALGSRALRHSTTGSRLHSAQFEAGGLMPPPVIVKDEIVQVKASDQLLCPFADQVCFVAPPCAAVVCSACNHCLLVHWIDRLVLDSAGKGCLGAFLSPRLQRLNASHCTRKDHNRGEGDWNHGPHHCSSPLER